MDWSFGVRYQIFNEANGNEYPLDAHADVSRRRGAARLV